MDRIFPSDFLWGAATAAYQIEGGSSQAERGRNIWDVFCSLPGATRSGDTGETACDHYNRCHEDIDLIRRLGLRAYRFSVSWPRVFPQGRGRLNAAGLAFYDRLVDGLCAAGVQPSATLYHWDLPAALQTELGGWANPELATIFADYAGVVCDRLGDRVRHWTTLNEPWCIAHLGHIDGLHAPGIKDQAVGYRVAHNLLRAHAHAVAQYRAGRHNHGLIGMALNTNFVYPVTQQPEDIAAAERALQNYIGWFADPAYGGDYPAVLRARLDAVLPHFTAEESRMLRGSLDFLGLNYYFSDIVRHAPDSGPLDLEPVPQPESPRTAMGWTINPDGLRALLNWMAHRYAGLPFYITENGVALPDEPDEHGYVQDVARIAYLRDHFSAAAGALQDGVDLRGYFVWSLLDNLEWADGFSRRFGLVRCDFQTLRRTIKASGHWYAQLIADGKLDAPPPKHSAAGFGVVG